MKILLAVLEVLGHMNPAVVLAKALQDAKHEVSLMTVPLDSHESAPMGVFVQRYIDAAPLHKAMLLKHLPGHDLMITEIAMLPGVEVHLETGVPWIQFGNLPIMYVAAETPCLLQACLPDLEPDFRKMEKVKFCGPLVPEMEKPTRAMIQYKKDHPEKRVIHITQGTLDKDHSKLVEPVAAMLKQNPDNLVLDFMVQHSQILPVTDVMVTNGGYGGVAAAIRYGVPLVVAGTNEDKSLVAERVERVGIGINLKTDRPNPADVEKAVESVLQNEVMKARCRYLSFKAREHFKPKEAVRLIEREFQRQTNARN